jgi:hypothetical protein
MQVRRQSDFFKIILIIFFWLGGKKCNKQSKELSKNRQLGCWGTNDHLGFTLYSSSNLFSHTPNGGR